MRVTGRESTVLRLLHQLALQRAAMHVEGARRRRNVAVMFVQDTLDMFPLEALNRQRARFDRGTARRDACCAESGEQRFDIHRLGQVLHGAQLDRIDRRADAGIPGQHHDAGFGQAFAQPGQQAEAGCAGEVEVETFNSTETGVVGGSEAQAALKRLLTVFAD